MKIVAIRDMCAGNETIGDMWQETAVFDGDTPVVELVRWAMTYLDGKTIPKGKTHTLRKRLTITVPQGEDFPRDDFVMPNAQGHGSVTRKEDA